MICNREKKYELFIIAFAFFLAVIFIVILYPFSANASHPILNGRCSTVSSGISGVSVFTTLMPCLIDVIQSSGRTMITLVQNLMAPVTNVFITFVIVIYGILLATGMLEKASRDMFVLLLKIAVVLWIVNDLMFLYESMYDLMEGLVVALSFHGFDGVVLRGTASRCVDLNVVWAQLDCLINMVVGVEAAETLTHGLFAFFFASVFSGVEGAMIGIIGLFFTVNLIIGAIKAAHIYLSSVVVLSLLVMAAAFIVPAIFFKSSYDYFSNWATMVISATIQAAIVFLFLGVVVNAMDVVIFSGDDSILRTIAGSEVDRPDFVMAEYLQSSGAYLHEESRYVIFDLSQHPFARALDSASRSGDKGAAKSWMWVTKGTSGQSSADLMASPNNFGFAFEFPIIDYSQLNGGATSMFDLTIAFIIASLVGYVFTVTMEQIPLLARLLSGGLHSTPELNSEGSNLSRVISGAGHSVGRYTSGLISRSAGMVSGR